MGLKKLPGLFKLLRRIQIAEAQPVCVISRIIRLIKITNTHPVVEADDLQSILIQLLGNRRQAGFLVNRVQSLWITIDARHDNICRLVHLQDHET